MNVFITGALTGMGRELSKRFLARGYTVGICSIEDESSADIMDGVHYFQADVRDADRMHEVIFEFSKKVGALDLVIANAGINHPKEAIPDWNRGRMVIETNLIGLLNTFAPSIDIMKKQKHGHLVGLASVSSFAGLPRMSCYGASKAGVMSMCESFEIDLATYGIHVTTIAPGFVATPLTKDNKHKMPFLISTEKAVDKIMYAIEHKKGLYVFPWQMKFIASFLKLMPRSLYKSLNKQTLKLKKQV